MRVRDLATRRRLLADGASSAVPEATEGSLHLGAQVLRALDVTEDDVLRLLDAARADDYAWLFERAALIKAKFKAYEKYHPLADRTLAMIFEKASTRTLSLIHI